MSCYKVTLFGGVRIQLCLLLPKLFLFPCLPSLFFFFPNLLFIAFSFSYIPVLFHVSLTCSILPPSGFPFLPYLVLPSFPCLPVFLSLPRPPFPSNPSTFTAPLPSFPSPSAYPLFSCVSFNFLTPAIKLNA